MKLNICLNGENRKRAGENRRMGPTVYVIVDSEPRAKKASVQINWSTEGL